LTSFQAFGHGEHEPLNDDPDEEPTDEEPTGNIVQQAVNVIRNTIYPAGSGSSLSCEKSQIFTHNPEFLDKICQNSRNLAHQARKFLA